MFVGVLKGPNRYFRNGGDGKFVDASEEIGLTQRVFNTRAICVVDLNGDKVPDIVFNNEGQESSVLLGNPKRVVKKVADGAVMSGWHHEGTKKRIATDEHGFSRIKREKA